MKRPIRHYISLFMEGAHCSSLRLTLDSVFASLGCCKEIPQAEWHKQQKYIFSQFSRLKGRCIRSLVCLFFPKAPLLDPEMAAFLVCPHIACLQCLHGERDSCFSFPSQGSQMEFFQIWLLFHWLPGGSSWQMSLLVVLLRKKCHRCPVVSKNKRSVVVSEN